MKRDPFYFPYQGTDEQRAKYWKMLGKYARGKAATVLTGVKY